MLWGRGSRMAFPGADGEGEMSKYYFSKGRMVIHTSPGNWGHVVWFRNGRGRGRYLASGPGVVDSPEYAEEIYKSFTGRGQLG